MPTTRIALKPVALAAWLMCAGAAVSIAAAPIAGANAVFPTAGSPRV